MFDIELFCAPCGPRSSPGWRRSNRRRRPGPALCVALVLGLALAVPSPVKADPVVVGTSTAATQVTVDESHFDWTNLEGDRALFEWSARVVNAGTRSFRVKVALELLDDDDQVILVDEVTIEVAAGQSRTVQQDGSMPYDNAANVVQSRFRVDPEPTIDRSERRGQG